MITFDDSEVEHDEITSSDNGKYDSRRFLHHDYYVQKNYMTTDQIAQLAKMDILLACIVGIIQ